MRYFINKETNQPIQVGDYTPSVLAECLTATRQVGTEMVEIEGQIVEQPKLELVWEEITEQEYKAKTEPSKEELNRQAKLERINELLNNLNNTDYIDHKYFEGKLTKEEFQKWCDIRQSWRDEINAIEKELALDKN